MMNLYQKSMVPFVEPQYPGTQRRLSFKLEWLAQELLRL
jgi:hypothetical protein